MIASLTTALWLGAVSARMDPSVTTFGDRVAPTLEVTGAPNAKVKLTTNVGSFSLVKQVSAGRYQAQFVLPAKRMPQLAIILVEVVAKGSTEHTWVTLALQAKADLRIETKPHARVTVSIGEQKVGVAVADRSGRATVTAIVPPCVATAQVRATDSAGNASDKPLDLRPEPFPHALIFAPADKASWADKDPTPIEVFAVDSACVPVVRAGDVQLLASVGEVAAPTQGLKGIVVFPFRAPDEVGGGSARLAVKVGSGASTAERDLRVVAGPQTGYALRFAPEKFTAGSKSVVRILPIPADARGNPVADGRPLEKVTSDFGTVRDALSGLELVLPDHFGGRQAVKVRGQGPGGTSEASFPLEAGAPHAIEWVSKPRLVRAGETLQAEVRVVDAYGNPVLDAPLRASIGKGGAVSVEPVGDGRYRIASNLPRDADVGTSALDVEAGDSITAAFVSRHDAVEVAPFQRPWGFVLGASVTGQTNFINAKALTPRLNLGLHVARSNFDFLLEAEANLYQSFNALPANGIGIQRTKFIGMGVALGGRYSIPLLGRWALHASGVIGIETVWSTLTLRTDVDTRSQVGRNTTFLLRGAVGASVGLGRGRAFLQIEGSWAPARGQLSGNLGGMGVTLGYLYGF